MAKVLNVRFTTAQIATWLEEANPSRRARWLHLPDAKALADDLNELVIVDRYASRRPDVRRVQQVAEMLRKVAAAFNDPALPWARVSLFLGAHLALCAARSDGNGELPFALMDSLRDDALKFPGLLLRLADEAEVAVAKKGDMFWLSEADRLRLNYGMNAKTLERHTGTPTDQRSFARPWYGSPQRRPGRHAAQRRGSPAASPPRLSWSCARRR